MLKFPEIKMLPIAQGGSVRPRMIPVKYLLNIKEENGAIEIGLT